MLNIEAGSVDVFVPKIKETFTVDLTKLGIDGLLHYARHGIKQVLGDAAAGKDGNDAADAIKAKFARVYEWNATAARGPKRSPIDAAICEVVYSILRSAGEKGDAARNATKSVESAYDALTDLIGARMRKVNASTTDDEVLAKVDANWEGPIATKAREIAAARSAAISLEV